MKKSIIALAVAGAMTAPLAAQADATLYGAVAVDYINKDLSNDDKGYFQLDDTVIGVKASSEADGLTSGAQLEFEMGAAGDDFSATYANAYLAGDFGTVIAGKIANPINDVTGDSLGTSDSAEFGAGFGLDPVSDEIVAAAYMTPDMGGVSGYVGFQANSGDVDGGASNTVDAYLAGVKVAQAGFYGHLGYLKAKDASIFSGTIVDTVAAALAISLDTVEVDTSVLGLKLGYAVDEWSVGGVVTRYKLEGEKAVSTYGLNAGYDLGATDLYAFYVVDKLHLDGVDKMKTLGVKASYKLGTGASAYAEWSKTTNQFVDDAAVDYQDDNKILTIGYKVSF